LANAVDAGQTVAAALGVAVTDSETGAGAASFVWQAVVFRATPVHADATAASAIITAVLTLGASLTSWFTTNQGISLESAWA
jgi:hypothetical protein